jgi:hypothetical protein
MSEHNVRATGIDRLFSWIVAISPRLLDMWYVCTQSNGHPADTAGRHFWQWPGGEAFFAKIEHSRQTGECRISRELHRTIDVVSPPLLVPGTEASTELNSSARIVGELRVRCAAKTHFISRS